MRHLYARRRAGATRGILIGVVVVVAAAVIAVIMFVRGTMGIDDWVVRQFAGLLDRYIVPTFAFDSFNYEAPRVVVFEGVTLTAPDGSQIVKAGALRVTLAETPRVGRPIKIAEIGVDRGTLRLLRDLDDDDTIFKGLVPFVKRDPLRDPSSVPEGQRLSDVLQIRTVRLTRGSLEYDAGAGQRPMLLEGLDLDLDITPVELDTGEVWHRLTTLFDRSPLVRLDLNGMVNLDTFNVRLESTTLEMRVSDESIGVLPPELQQVLRDYDARGHLKLTAAGTIVVGDYAASDLETDVELTNFNVAAGEYRLPIDTGRFVTTLRDTTFSVEPAVFSLLGGTVTAHVDAVLKPTTTPTQARWSFENLDLEQLLRTAPNGGTPPRLAGKLNGVGSVALDARDTPSSVRGEGTLGVTQGRLVAIPVLSTIINAMSALTSGGSAARQDTLDAVFTLAPHGVDVTSFDYRSDVVAARGRGRVNYDGGLDFTLNGGPVERVQAGLGQLGRLLGRVTDGIVSYRVRGTVKEPSVSVHPLGIGS